MPSGAVEATASTLVRLNRGAARAPGKLQEPKLLSSKRTASAAQVSQGQAGSERHRGDGAPHDMCLTALRDRRGGARQSLPILTVAGCRHQQDARTLHASHHVFVGGSVAPPQRHADDLGPSLRVATIIIKHTTSNHRQSLQQECQSRHSGLLTPVQRSTHCQMALMRAPPLPLKTRQTRSGTSQATPVTPTALSLAAAAMPAT